MANNYQGPTKPFSNLSGPQQNFQIDWNKCSFLMKYPEITGRQVKVTA